MNRRTYTWSQAERECRALGFTLRRSGYGKEHVLYRQGTSADHPAAYFTECPKDAAETCRAMTAR